MRLSKPADVKARYNISSKWIVEVLNKMNEEKGICESGPVFECMFFLFQRSSYYNTSHK